MPEIQARYPVRVTGPCMAVLVSLDSGSWSQTLTGTRNQGKKELFGVLRSWHALKSVKQVESWSDVLQQPMSDDLELVFTENPFVLQVGDKLRLKVLHRGLPLPVVSLAYHRYPQGVTDKDGRVNLRIRHPGLQVITASLEEPLQSQCTECHHEYLVAFSCKRRGFCPSCGARRMAESAALLLPKVRRRGQGDRSCASCTHGISASMHVIASIEDQAVIDKILPIYGYIYDCKTGQLVEIPEATAAGSPTA